MIVDIDHKGQRFTFEHEDGDHIGVVQGRTRAFYELDLLEELDRRLAARPGLVVDVGAHVGNHSVFFAGVMGRQVIALEPNPRTALMLMGNVARNGLADDVTVLQVAAGARPGWASLCPAVEGNSGMQSVDLGARAGVLVSPVSLLVSSETPAALVKLDAEGSEPEILHGLMAMLLSDRPVIAMEARCSDELAQQRAILEPVGYRPSDRSWCATPVHIWEPRGER